MLIIRENYLLEKPPILNIGLMMYKEHAMLLVISVRRDHLRLMYLYHDFIKIIFMKK